MDGALGFNTFEKQDKVLVGLNGGMDAAVTVRILQEQGFAVQAALVHFAGMADDAVETAQNAAKALDVTLHVIEAADTAADELLKFQLLMQTADKLDCRFISTGHYARVEQDADECRLCAPEHAECDQTALLEVLPQEILARLILVNSTRNPCRKLRRISAARNKLPQTNADVWIEMQSCGFQWFRDYEKGMCLNNSTCLFVLLFFCSLFFMR